jgi:hypothetical protein
MTTIEDKKQMALLKKHGWNGPWIVLFMFYFSAERVHSHKSVSGDVITLYVQSGGRKVVTDPVCEEG